MKGFIKALSVATTNVIHRNIENLDETLNYLASNKEIQYRRRESVTSAKLMLNFAHVTLSLEALFVKAQARQIKFNPKF